MVSNALPFIQYISARSSVKTTQVIKWVRTTMNDLYFFHLNDTLVSTQLKSGLSSLRDFDAFKAWWNFKCVPRLKGLKQL